MKLVIAGGRDINVSTDFIKNVLEKITGTDDFPFGWKVDEVVSGCAKGADTSGELFASRYHIPIKKFKAKWDKYFNRAGHIRNRDMALYADALLLIWDGKSAGSRNMLCQMNKLNKPVHQVIV